MTTRTWILIALRLNTNWRTMILIASLLRTNWRTTRRTRFNGKEMVFAHCNLTKRFDWLHEIHLGPFILRRLKSDVMQQLHELVLQKLQRFPRTIANHPLLVRRIYSDEDVVRFARKLHPMGAFGFECTLDKLLLYYGVSDKRGLLPDKFALLSSTSQLRFLSVNPYPPNVSTQVTERQTIVDTLNNDTSIFACLLSTRVGGQGLNLVGADTVVIHDMEYNPQIYRQAEDRCHCIGQVKPVTIYRIITCHVLYRLVTKATVDENVYEIAKGKLVLDAAVLESGVERDNEGDTSTMGEILLKLLLG
ncbi:SWI/SNF-related matrix-associated actin-dependent regulated protein 1B [Pyrus ussuriensis x Pyrus communis]|uniref:SWI/SNF-related matrix-associated actin-dependent regulated protein 1B n=1 Tax=Pyrus ussuriensis x Pyrus communis TaxID=2448454 RepID=A0A5N5HIS9_9ROSA|nr:SWI/SNF-related matrix-associated actin-dependent regulated protein 1B [Pyrus ussuriensis x Pyrus communis]